MFFLKKIHQNELKQSSKEVQHLVCIIPTRTAALDKIGHFQCLLMSVGLNWRIMIHIEIEM